MTIKVTTKRTSELIKCLQTETTGSVTIFLSNRAIKNENQKKDDNLTKELLKKIRENGYCNTRRNDG